MGNDLAGNQLYNILGVQGLIDVMSSLMFLRAVDPQALAYGHIINQWILYFVSSGGAS